MLSGKVALVTGGTRGIGLSIVKKYLENGATVVLYGSRQETADKAIKELKEIDGALKVEGIGLDLSDPKAIEEEFNRVKDKYGSLDILVNNAGVSQSESIYEMDPQDFLKVIDINVNNLFFCSQRAAKIMKEQGGGVIINTSSMVSIQGQESGVAYPTSKFAVNGMTISLARELGKDNIRVNAVAPGVTNTDMVKELPKDIVDYLVATTPLGRIGEPEDVANAFLFLASDMASFVTGEILSVDGAKRV